MKKTVKEVDALTMHNIRGGNVRDFEIHQSIYNVNV